MYTGLPMGIVCTCRNAINLPKYREGGKEGGRSERGSYEAIIHDYCNGVTLKSLY